jgi:predicted permease
MSLQNALHDLRYALRQLRKNPGFFVLAVGTLALGIAACSTIFSWIDSTLLDPIPGISGTGSMVTIQRGERSIQAPPPLSYPDYVDLRDSTAAFSGLIAHHEEFMAITGTGEPERIYGVLASSNYFTVLGVRPILGTLFTPPNADEPLGAPQAVIGYALWQYRFSGDPAIVGKTIQINRHSYTILGVAPRGFEGCTSGLRAQIWIPLGMDYQVTGSTRVQDRGDSWLNVVGVLRPGVGRQQAENQLNLLMRRIAERYPESHRADNRLSLDPLWRSPFGANVYLSGILPMLLALAGLLLLLACVNVANLLLARSVSRRREFAIRLAIGAGRWKLVRQLMVENLLLALAAGAAAIAITLWTAHLLGSFLPMITLPLDIDGHVNSTVLLATFLVAALTAGLSGAVPALRASALTPVSVLKGESSSTTASFAKSRLAAALAAAQIALSLVLLTCAGLFFRSLVNAQSINPGFDPEHVYLVSYDVKPLGYTTTRAIEFDRQILQRVQALPGVNSATLASFSPLSFTIGSDGVVPEGYIPQTHESVVADTGAVGPGYLHTLSTPLLAGRDFTDSDNADTLPVALVNQAFADRYWPRQQPIGKRVLFDSRSYTVVGVTANAKYRGLVYAPPPLLLLPLMQDHWSPVILHVRVNGDPASFDSAIEGTIHGLNSDLPLFDVSTLRQNMVLGGVFQRITSDFAGVFGLIAMLLAATGVYGVVAYSTRQRTHEIGIRMALGAGQGNVFRSVLGHGARLALFGLAAGLIVSLAFTRFLRGMLFGVGAVDWFTLASVAVLLFLVALAACFFPARRAASVDPMQALRTE